MNVSILGYRVMLYIAIKNKIYIFILQERKCQLTSCHYSSFGRISRAVTRQLNSLKGKKKCTPPPPSVVTLLNFYIQEFLKCNNFDENISSAYLITNLDVGGSQRQGRIYTEQKFQPQNP